MTTKYVAFDGSMFDDFQECAEYERVHKPRVTGYDESGKKVEDIYTQWQAVMYVDNKAMTEEECEAFAALLNRGPASADNSPFPEFPGRWYWDSLIDEWRDLDEAYPEVMRAAEVFYGREYKALPARDV